MTSTLRTIAIAAALTGIASVASAVTSTPFDTPLSAGDNTKGSARADAFESFVMTQLSFTTADALRANVSYTINPFLTDLQGNTTNVITLAMSINGGSLTDLTINAIDVGVGTIGAGGLTLSLAQGDTVSFFIQGEAGRSGNLVDFIVETAAVPVLPAGALAMTGIAALSAARRGRKNKA